MSQFLERRTVSFIVRLWTEPGLTPGALNWRGQVEHVGSGQIIHFQIPPALVEFLVSCLPAPQQADEPSERALTS